MSIVKISFELNKDQPEWFYWLTIKIGDMAVGHIAKNKNVDEKYLLTIYNPRFSDYGRITFCLTEYYDTVGEAKERFFKIPVGEFMHVTSQSNWFNLQTWASL